MIFTQPQDQFWATRANWKEMSELIEQKWSEEFCISELCYGDEMYFVLMEKHPYVLKQEYYWRRSQEELIQIAQEKEVGYSITSFFGDGEFCCMVVSKLQETIEQKWIVSKEFPNAQISKNWKNNYSIGILNWAMGKWFLVLNRNVNYAQKEAWELTFRVSEYKISKKLSENNRSIISLCFGDGKWALAYAKHPEIHATRSYVGSEFPSEKISEYWNDNFEISQVAYGKNKWFLSFVNYDTTVDKPPIEMPPQQKNIPKKKASRKENENTQWKKKLAEMEQEKREKLKELKNKEL